MHRPTLTHRAGRGPARSDVSGKPGRALLQEGLHAFRPVSRGEAEREDGTLLRLRIAPITRVHILGGKAGACFLANVVVIALLLTLGRFVFGVRLESPLLLSTALVCTSLSFVGIMMLLSTLGRTEEAVAGSSWGTLLILGMIGGAMVPRFVMPQVLQTVGLVTPHAWALDALSMPTRTYWCVATDWDTCCPN